MNDIMKYILPYLYVGYLGFTLLFIGGLQFDNWRTWVIMAPTIIFVEIVKNFKNELD